MTLEQKLRELYGLHIEGICKCNECFIVNKALALAKEAKEELVGECNNRECASKGDVERILGFKPASEKDRK